MLARRLALSIPLLLAACSSDPETTDPPDTMAPDVATDTAEDTPVDADAAPDVTDDTPTDSDAATDTDTEVEVDTGPPPCEPALALSPAEMTVAPLELVQLAPDGGTGAYRVLMTDNQTGAVFTIGERRYIAGDHAGTDTITLTDSGCAGEATARFTVVEPPAVRPSTITVRPGASFTFEVTGGSGEYTVEFVSNRTGGALDGLAYTAGTRQTFDTIRFTDDATGRDAEATVTVNETAELVLEAPRVALPVGGVYQVNVESGSGNLETVGDVAPWLRIESGRIEGLAPGEWTQTLRDPFSGLTADLEIDVVRPLEGDFSIAGNLQTSSSVHPLGDINGDGFADVAVAIAEADVDAYNSGAVFIYLGAADGFSGVPEQTLSGRTYEEEFGRGVAFADVNGDGAEELIVGASGADIGGTNIGAVHFFERTEDGLFEDEPAATLTGVNSGDRFGISLTTCDFDGDGVQDLAVGAHTAEDRDAPIRSNSQGAVHVYRGEEGSFPVAPTRVLFGALPDRGRWLYRNNMQMGVRVTAGDFDGDGACDIAAGAYTVPIEGDGSDGAVVLFRGILRTTSQELVSPRASLALAATEPGDDSMNFGRALAAGDIDNDGVDELIVGAFAHNGPSGNDTGGAFVYEWSTTLQYTEELTPMQDADWRYEGTNAGYYVGGWVSVDDANGDGIDDLISGNWRGDIDSEDELNRPGSIDVFFGRDGALPAAEPSFSAQGIASESFFGEGAAAFGDADGDGETNFMVVAGRFDDDGADYPQAFHFNGMDSPQVRRAILPAIGSGFDFGRGVSLVDDITGDGRPDIVVGAPLAPSPGLGSQVGEVLVYSGSDDDISTEPSQRLRGFLGQSNGDRTGWTVGGGDFDGDGTSDLFLVSRNDDMPGSFGSEYHDPFSCSGARNNSSSVRIFLGRSGAELATEPDFVFYPEQTNTLVDDIAVVDFDGDGRDDIMLGASGLDRPDNPNCGGIILLRGRRYFGGGLTTVLCEPDTLVYGASTDDRLGTSVAAAGDLDGDGCDEVVVGAPREDLGVGNQGTVRVVFGAGSSCSTSQIRVALAASGRSNAQAGIAVDSGLDVDGDAISDVIVGGPFYREANAVPGGAWLLSGERLLGLSTGRVTDGVMPNETWESFTNVGVEGNFGLRGRTTDEEFGRAVALVPDLDGDGRGEVAVGAPRADYAGSGRTGAVSVHSFEPDEGLSARPILIFGGEIGPPEGRVGELLSAGPVGLRVVLIVGGPRGSSLGLQSGSVYVVPLSRF